MKKVIGMVLVIVFIFLVGCTSDKEVVGTWISDTGDQIQFIDEETMIYEDVALEYKLIDGEKLMYSTPTGEVLIFDYIVKGNELTLSYEGESIVFTAE